MKILPSAVLITALSVLTLSSPLLAQETETPDSSSSIEKISPSPSQPPSVSEDANLETKAVKSIEVKGNKTISLATILSKIKTKVGQNYLQSVVSDDLKRLYNTGYFSDVRVDREDYEGGLRVIIFVTEKVVIEEVTFSKTRYIRPKALQKKIKTQKGKFLDNKVLQEDINTIKELYQKKGLTTVEVDPETFVDEVTNKASVHFVIKEGRRIVIKRINVYGNIAFKDKRIKKVIKIRAKTLFNSGFLNEDTLKEDVERINSFYEQEGYIDASTQYSVRSLAQGRVEVNFDIKEGKRYRVGSLNFMGNQVISSKELLKSMEEIKQGGIFSRQKLSVDLANIRTLYFDRGYIFANVTESTSLDPDTGKVDIKVEIVEGKVAYLEKVKIEGNTRTRDIVIRRELKMYPGDRFDGTKLKKSKEKLTDLQYFEDVSFDIEDTDVEDRKNLLVQVKEAKTGTFSFGGGFSTVDNVIGFVEVEQRNFDFANWPTFTGGGQYLSLRAETGATRNNYQLSFTEPWLFDRPISGGFDVYKSTREKSDDTGYAYDEDRVGGVIRFGKKFNELFSGGVSYKNERVKIENFDSGVSADLLAEEGANRLSVLGLTLTRDSRDSTINPSRGLYLNGGVDFAGGALAGDKDFYRIQTRDSYYVPLKYKSVLEFRFRTGIVDSYGDSDKVPIFERFFAGGARSIRGYNERKIGPLDPVTEDAIGGEAMMVANIEYTIPLIDVIKLAGFFDTGNVWGKTSEWGEGGLKSGAGLGLRIKTPVGPISLDYGIPLNDEPGEDERSGKFYFSVSRGF